ncbi:hypothetical protein OG455_41660 [Kitasatospora sp. NBC_01287]|uniref:hypothetical protein n=1 Tax=Kitasatospora sp. NBC_01287 TaxID=2903573 RepID=UPI00224FB0ED|nr:hypothetical protein [Kitasatospora sp. NBC_01287]MCX4751757.1 hypothetical protein [Kitasatospora sp. NBC_01287]MCX4751951.1 hypothetical protein [Kitasatospora sp. NBC_01287]
MIESSPLPGSIGLTSIAGAVGLGIRVGQWLNGGGFTEFEHAFLVLPDGQLLEAEPGGARIAGLDEYAGRHVEYVAPAGLTDGQRAAICAAALRYVGVGYSAAEYFAIAAHRFHLPVPGLRRHISDSRRMICSQLVDQCYQDAGVHLFQDGRWPGYVTPGDLWQLLGRGEQR